MAYGKTLTKGEPLKTTKTVLLRNIPEALHRELKMAAAKLGKTLQSFILEAAAELARRK
jgi:uncharacterized protein (DUF1778 family)